MRSVYVIVLLFVLSSAGCNNRKGEPVSSVKTGSDDMAELNSYFVQKDRERIINYAERKGLKLVESPTGLWFQVEKEGKGEYFKDMDKVVIDYDCSLLDGTKCYSSAVSGPREIILGKTPLEAGLYEGLKMLKPGGEAVFILPPFLAYGLIGDNKAIPARSTLVYRIKILNDR